MNGTKRRNQNFFYNSQNFSVVDLNPNIALLTAKIRADFNFKLPDAVQLAIFEFMGLDLFLTNDVQLKRYDENKVIILSVKHHNKISSKRHIN